MSAKKNTASPARGGESGRTPQGPIAAISLLKLAATIGIIWIHTVSFRPDNNFAFNSTQTLVEMFLMITGYFTFRHFHREQFTEQKLEDKSRSAWQYSSKKLLRFWPLLAVAVIAVHIPLFSVSSGNNLLLHIRNAILGSLFLTGIPGAYPMTPVWYLSALFIVFPLFCLLCQTKYPRTLSLVTLASGICYYFAVDGNPYKTIGIVPRAFIGLCMGVLVYTVSQKLSAARLTGLSRALLAAAALACVGMLVRIYSTPIAGFANKDTTKEFCILLITALLVILLSGQTFLSSCRHRLFGFVETLSLNMFVLHYVVVFYINRFWPHLELNTKLIVLYIATVVLSLVYHALSELVSAGWPAVRKCFVDSEK